MSANAPQVQSAALPAACDFLQGFQSQAQSIWQNQAWPTKKTENWKYTSLAVLEKNDYFSKAAEEDQAVDEALLQAQAIAGLKTVKLVFQNGRLLSSASELENLPEGVSFTAFSQASPEQQDVISANLNTAIDVSKHEFAAVNAQRLTDGVLLHVAKNQELDCVFEVLNISTPGASEFSAATRLLVVLEENAKAKIIERFSSAEIEQNSAVLGFSELLVAAGARLQHYRMHLEQEDIVHIGGVFATLQANAELQGFHLAQGSKLKRVDINVDFLGAGAHCELNGVYLPKNNQLIDYHTCMEHRVAHCTSNETFRGIVADNAKAVFNGRIHIHPQAQKTAAHLSNKNLLTSDKAEVDTKPELEIYADDVQCSHGATVAQLDTGALHYFLTRGISESEARVMLSFGFINELVNRIPLAALSDYIRPLLAQHFAQDAELLRHIA